MTRADLEQWRTAEQMAELIRQYDEDTVRDPMYARWPGVIKDFTEEYVPLWKLIRQWPRVVTACLAPKSHPGPDAWLRLVGGRERSVQITLAGISFCNRIAAVSRRVYFPDQAKTYERRTQSLQGSGRVLQAPAGLVKKHADAVVAAIARKRNDCSGTDILLVVHERVLPRRLRNAAKHLVRARFKQAMARIRFKQAVARMSYRATFVLCGDSVVAL